jgi:hypothetical protein
LSIKKQSAGGLLRSEVCCSVLPCRCIAADSLQYSRKTSLSLLDIFDSELGAHRHKKPTLDRVGFQQTIHFSSFSSGTSYLLRCATIASTSSLAFKGLKPFLVTVWAQNFQTILDALLIVKGNRVRLVRLLPTVFARIRQTKLPPQQLGIEAYCCRGGCFLLCCKRRCFPLWPNPKPKKPA